MKFAFQDREAEGESQVDFGLWSSQKASYLKIIKASFFLQLYPMKVMFFKPVLVRASKIM